MRQLGHSTAQVKDQACPVLLIPNEGRKALHGGILALIVTMVNNEPDSYACASLACAA
jgi:hypothetical protein